MTKSSINFQKAHHGATAHNDRSIIPEYVIDDISRNEINRTSIAAKNLLSDLLKKAKVNYKKLTSQKLQAKSYHWEAVVNLNENHTLKDVEKLAYAIEEETGFTQIQVSIHKDEGHINKSDIKIYNYHAHINFFTLHKNTGQQLYRKSLTKKQKKDYPHLKPINRERLSKLQDLTAECLKMERGKVGSTAVRRNHKQYRQEQQELAILMDVSKITLLREIEHSKSLKESKDMLESDLNALESKYYDIRQEIKIFRNYIVPSDEANIIKDATSLFNWIKSEFEKMNQIINNLNEEHIALMDENMRLKLEVSIDDDLKECESDYTNINDTTDEKIISQLNNIQN